MKETIFDIIRRHDEWFFSEETTPPEKIAQIYEDIKQSAIQYAHDLLELGDRWHMAFKNQIEDAYSKWLYPYHIDRTKYKYILEDFLVKVRVALVNNCGLDKNELRQKFDLKIQFLIGLSDTPYDTPRSKINKKAEQQSTGETIDVGNLPKPKGKKFSPKKVIPIKQLHPFLIKEGIVPVDISEVDFLSRAYYCEWKELYDISYSNKRNGKFVIFVDLFADEFFNDEYYENLLNQLGMQRTDIKRHPKREFEAVLKTYLGIYP